MKIQGANDGETIEIKLDKIDAKTLGLDSFSVAPGKVPMNSAVALKSEAAPTLTQVNAADGKVGTVDAFGATYATDDLPTYFDANAKTTGDVTDANGAGKTDDVYQIQVDGQTYFVAQDGNAAGGKFNLLKQNGTGYEKSSG